MNAMCAARNCLFAVAIVAAGAVSALAPQSVEAQEAGPSARPRVIMNASRLPRLRNLAAGGDTRFTELAAWGAEHLHATTDRYISPGYARSGWAEAVRNYALLYMLEPDASRREAFAAEALVYMKALADDYESVGDAKGGLAPVQADNGYPIRNHAVGLAIGYDWLSGWSGLDADTRSHFVTRINSWIDWYEGADGGKGGYQVGGKPWENYFTGYFAAKALCAAATWEDNPKAREVYLPQAMAAMRGEILPSLAQSLAGGYPPEGWAYRSGYDRTIDALLTLENASGSRFDRSFFAPVVRAIIHSTKPDRKHVYDGGDWGGDYAGYPLPLALMARLSTLLDGTAAEYARFYVFDFAVKDHLNALSPADSILYLDPYAPRTDFTRNEALSHHSPGAGLVTWRSSWNENAFWGSLQSGAPHLADHQNRDQGHLTINYAGSDLLIDAGMWREKIDGGAVNNYASETAWHNSIMIDDVGRETGLSQGTYGQRSNIAFEDGGSYVFVKADLTGAYSYYPWRKGSNSARRVLRDVLYLRPAAVIIRDEVVPLEAAYPRSLLFHFPRGARPELSGDTLTLHMPEASMKVVSMMPASPDITLDKLYGTRAGDEEKGVHTWRLEIAGPVGEPVARFMTLLSAQRGSSTRFVGMEPVVQGQNGIVLASGEERIAVIWASRPEAPLSFQLPVYDDVHIYVIGLKPGTAYAFASSTEGDRLSVTIGPANRGTRASNAGILDVHLQSRAQPRL